MARANKLSLTVFGCNVHTPGRRDINFLLVSDVLDHDSQMARLLVSKVLSIVKDKDAYQWSKVKMLHLVCDCGPHFRSREGFAFFLHDLVKDWKVNVPQLLSGNLCVLAIAQQRVQTSNFLLDSTRKSFTCRSAGCLPSPFSFPNTAVDRSPCTFWESSMAKDPSTACSVGLALGSRHFYKTVPFMACKTCWHATGPGHKRWSTLTLHDPSFTLRSLIRA